MFDAIMLIRCWSTVEQKIMQWHLVDYGGFQNGRQIDTQLIQAGFQYCYFELSLWLADFLKTILLAIWLAESAT